MWHIAKKEIQHFFNSLLGFVVFGIFLTLVGLTCWFFPNNFNILNYGFADLIPYFNLMPWLMVIFVPAITMRSYADEYKTGTIEILFTKPLTKEKIVFGKFLGNWILVVLMLLPTLFYYYSVYELGATPGNIDFGSSVGSYIGLLFVSACFCSLGTLISTLSSNNLVVLISGIVTSFFFFWGFDGLSLIFNSADTRWLNRLGLSSHFESMARGVLDTKDLIYFLGLTSFFLILTFLKISDKKSLYKSATSLSIILVLIIFGQYFNMRFDLTKDKRYTLSKASASLVKSAIEPVHIKVYLEGSFPQEFQKLQDETRFFLEEIAEQNSSFSYDFIDPQSILKDLVKKGMRPSQLTVEENGTVSEQIIMPYAEIVHQNKSSVVSLLLETGQQDSQESQLKQSIEKLEYAFYNGLSQVLKKKTKSIAVLTGNGQLEDIYLYDFLKNVGIYYNLGKITLNGASSNPEKTLSELKKYNLSFNAKPTKAFSESQKAVLDQAFMNGQKSLWLIDQVQADQDSLMNNGKMLALPRDLNLDDLFFAYGLRVSRKLTTDLYAAKITLASGEVGGRTQFQPYLWYYHPLVVNHGKHPITNNLGPIRNRYVTSIDTLSKKIKHQVILKSSPLTHLKGSPAMVDFSAITVPPSPKMFSKGEQIFGVLSEGVFNSSYKNRYKPIALDFKEESKANALVVFADGDLASNEILKGNPLPLGLNKWTNEKYDNLNLMLNTINYLMGDKDIIQIRNKQLPVAFMNKEKIYTERSYWQWFNLIAPLMSVIIFGAIYAWSRYYRYMKK